MKRRISASVGLKGVNREKDVRLVQVLLNRHYTNGGILRKNMPLRIDGLCESKTIEAIHYFQTKVLHFPRPDSKVDPQKRTFQHLQKIWYSKKDEGYKILKYIIQEIKTNVQSETVKKIKFL